MRRICWILVALLGLAAPSAWAAPPTRLVTVALEGEPAPGGAEPLRTVFSGHFLNDRGDVGFVANLGPVGSGLSGAFARFFEGGFDAVRSDDTPPPAWGGSYSFLTAPALNEDRELALTAGGPSNGWLRKDAGGVSVILQVGDPVSGRPGYSYDWNPTEFDLNASGEFLLTTSLQGPGGASNGIVIVDGASQDVVAINGDAAPTPGNDSFSWVSDRADLNDAGEVAFYAEVGGVPATRGVFARLGGSLVSVALDGDAVPGAPGRTLEFSTAPRPSLSETGAIVFDAWLAPCCAPPGTGIFHWQAGTLTTLLLAGAPVPDSGGRVFDSVASPRIHSAGAVVFDGASYDGLDWIPGVYWLENGVTSRLVEAGDAIPGTGSRLQGFAWQSVEINERGDVSFFAVLEDGRAGIFLLTSEAPPVPALGPLALVLLACALGVSGRRALR